MNVVELAQKIISIPSNSGEEKDVANFLFDYIKDSCDESWIDKLNNVVGVINGKEEGPTILFNGHIDHVPEGDMEDPFSAKIVDGEKWGTKGLAIYGRGASDNKGGVASLFHAAKEIAKNRDFKGRLIVSAAALEEPATGGTGIRGMLDDIVDKYGKPDFMLSAEATKLDITLGHRGKVEFLLETKGVTSHASNPSNGINAILMMNTFLNKWLKVELPYDPLLGQCTTAITQIWNGNIELSSDDEDSKMTVRNVIPDSCFLQFDRRYLPSETPESVKKELVEFLEGIKEEYEDFKYNLEITGVAPPVHILESNPFFEPLKKAAQFKSKDPEIRSWIFGTDGAVAVNDYDIPTIGYGPGSEDFAHTPEDHIPIEHLKIASSVYQHFILNL